MKCDICKLPTLSQHHIVPRGEGGKDIAKNRVPLCQRHHNLVEWVYEQYSSLYCPRIRDLVRLGYYDFDFDNRYKPKTANDEPKQLAIKNPNSNGVRLYPKIDTEPMKFKNLEEYYRFKFTYDRRAMSLYLAKLANQREQRKLKKLRSKLIAQ